MGVLPEVVGLPPGDLIDQPHAGAVLPWFHGQVNFTGLAVPQLP